MSDTPTCYAVPVGVRTRNVEGVQLQTDLKEKTREFPTKILTTIFRLRHLKLPGRCRRLRSQSLGCISSPVWMGSRSMCRSQRWSDRTGTRLEKGKHSNKRKKYFEHMWEIKGDFL